MSKDSDYDLDLDFKDLSVLLESGKESSVCLVCQKPYALDEPDMLTQEISFLDHIATSQEFLDLITGLLVFCDKPDCAEHAAFRALQEKQGIKLIAYDEAIFQIDSYYYAALEVEHEQAEYDHEDRKDQCRRQAIFSSAGIKLRRHCYVRDAVHDFMQSEIDTFIFDPYLHQGRSLGEVIRIFNLLLTICSKNDEKHLSFLEEIRAKNPELKLWNMRKFFFFLRSIFNSHSPQQRKNTRHSGKKSTRTKSCSPNKSRPSRNLQA